jgi:hypothetical protein
MPFRFGFGNLKLMWSCWVEDIDESEKEKDPFYFTLLITMK